MAAQERISDLGYCMLGKETVKGTAVRPTITMPLVQETIAITAHLDDINPIIGSKVARYAAIKGLRDLQGNLEIIAEPNTIGYMLDMLLTHLSVTGSGPYTHTWGISPLTNPNSYTVEFQKGLIVTRYYGLEASELTPAYQTNKLHVTAKVTALGEFSMRTISTFTGGSSTIVLDTNYDPNPTAGLVVGDLIRVWAQDAGTYQDAVVATITNATTFTYTGTLTSVVAGDIVTLRPQATTLNFLDWFQWAKTLHQFGTNMTAANSAPNTNLETGSLWHLIHTMMPVQGANRSGSYNPLSIVRGLGDVGFNTKIFWDSPDELMRFLNTTNRAVKVRHQAGATNTYEMDVNIYSMVPDTDTVPINVNTVLFNNVTWKPTYSPSDAKMFDVNLINGVAAY